MKEIDNGLKEYLFILAREIFSFNLESGGAS